jgi:ribosomal protein L12E/L44/L45/RPP1/RPP2
VIISGDSDFSPLVSKLRENNKTVIGVGVKSSTSDLLIANCDEFIYYDDLVRQTEKKQRARRKSAPKAQSGAPKEQAKAEKSEEDRKQEAFDLVLDTIEALAGERDQDEKIWGSMVKQTLKRRSPGFNETYYGFRTFSDLLEDAKKHKLLELELDQKSGGYIIKRVAE